MKINFQLAPGVGMAANMAVLGKRMREERRNNEKK